LVTMIVLFTAMYLSAWDLVPFLFYPHNDNKFVLIVSYFMWL
jgi:hypothetical protein